MLHHAGNSEPNAPSAQGRQWFLSESMPDHGSIPIVECGVRAPAYGFDRGRVLVLAYACSPYRGSEPGVGWHRVAEIANYFDTWVLCKQQDYEDDIRRYFAANPNAPGGHFCFLPNSKLELRLKRIPGLWYLAYNLWHRRAYRCARRLHGRVGFSLIHQVTLASFREPGYLWKLGVPFVWGPIGGTQNYPARFIAAAGLRGALREGWRGMLNSLQVRYSRRIRRAARAASALLAANTTVLRDFRRHLGKEARLMSTAGTEAITERPCSPSARQGPLRLLWCGVMEHHKALHLLIRALEAMPGSVAYELRIVGAGSLANRWRRLAQRTGVESHCTWLGWVSHDAVERHYEWADVLMFTSLRETAGMVVLEALSHGVPVICLDHQGPGDMVTADCGIKIPVTTPRRVISALREAIVLLARDRSLLSELSVNAYCRAKDFEWSAQGREIADIYLKVLNTSDRREKGPSHARSAGAESHPRPGA